MFAVKQRDVSIVPNLSTYRFFAMKLLFIISFFWVTTLIEGVPNDYEQWLQPRGIGDWPFISWIYGGVSEDINCYKFNWRTRVYVQLCIVEKHIKFRVIA